jgi:hypothetical protein
MTDSIFGAIALVLVVLAPARPAVAAAQDPGLAGVFQVGPGADDEVDRAIRAATEGAGFFVRTLGRRMLGEKLQPVATIRIALTDSTASITTAADEELRTPLSGAGASDPTGAGDSDAAHEGAPKTPADAVITRWDGAALVRTFREDEGIRRYRYTLDPDGRTLRVRVRVEGSKLPRPVEYELTYHR